MLVSPLDPDFKVVATINGVITSALGGILFDFFYHNYSSNYITESYRKYYGGFLNKLGM